MDRLTLKKIPGYNAAKSVYRAYRRIRAKRQEPFDAPKTWTGGLQHELGFWEGFLRTKGSDWGDEFAQRTDPTAPIDDLLLLARLASLSKEQVSILDVGAGPLSSVGKTYPGKAITLTAVDPLGADYQRILAKYAVVPPVPTLTCAAERLLDRFAPGTFDIAYARNSLDHGYDPVAAIRAMLSVVRPDGVVILRHKLDEGENAGYWGLHQWNFQHKRGRFLIWSRGIEHDVWSMVSDLGTGTCHQDGEWINCVISRR